MKDDEYYIKKIEELNKRNIDLLNSKEYLKGKDVYKVKKMLKKLDFFSILKPVINRKRKAKLSKIEEENNFKIVDKKIYYEKKPKIAVYTCITGNYDDIIDPFIEVENIDYYLFTDNKKDKSNLWNIETLPENVQEINNNILENRYIKFHPYELFEGKGYDYAIYIDGNIEVISDLTELTYATNMKTGLALHRHRQRNSIYNECEVCIIDKKGNYNKLKQQVERYRSEGFPDDFGLLECNVIVSKLDNINGKKILDQWWEEFKGSESLRDQIAFPYIIWKCGYTIEDIGFLGKNVYRNPKFAFAKKIHN